MQTYTPLWREYTLDRRGPKAAEGRDEAASTPITGDSQGFFGTGFAHTKKTFQGVDPRMPIVYTSGMDSNLTEIETMTTYTGRVYDCFGETMWEVEGESVEAVERDILDTWTGCIEAHGYAVINDEDGSEEAVERFPSVRLNKMWSEYGDF